MADHVLHTGLDVVFFGSDGGDAARYHGGILEALAARGHRVTVYLADPAVLLAGVPRAGRADVILKARGEGVLDVLVDRAVLAQRRPGQRIVYWDARPRATPARPGGRYRARIPRFDLVLTASSSGAAARGYEALGARSCVPLLAAVDPDAYAPGAPCRAFAADLSLLSSAADASVVDAFFFQVARALPERRFVLGGSGWDTVVLPDNVRWAGEVGATLRSSFHASAGVVLHLGRLGGLPGARLLEAACAGACVITDAWEDLERFLAPGREVLVARDGMEVARLLYALGPEEAAAIGQAAQRRVRADHTCRARAALLEQWITRPLRPPLDGRALLPALAS